VGHARVLAQGRPIAHVMLPLSYCFDLASANWSASWFSRSLWGIILMFGFMGSKAAAQRKSEAAAMASVKRAQYVWDYADLSKRTSLLKRVINAQDDRLFLAYVHATWPQIPYSDRMKLVLEVMRREGNERTVNRAGEMVAKCFSAETFNLLFGQRPYGANWTLNDALGIWHSLGCFCFLISIGSLIGLPEADEGYVVGLGQKALMKTWNMPAPALKRFELFNATKLPSAISIYTPISDSETFGRFISLFISEITGKDVSFSPNELSSSMLERLLQGQETDIDPFLHNKVASLFATVKSGVREQFRTFET